MAWAGSAWVISGLERTGATARRGIRGIRDRTTSRVRGSTGTEWGPRCQRIDGRERAGFPVAVLRLLSWPAVAPLAAAGRRLCQTRAVTTIWSFSASGANLTHVLGSAR